MSHVKTALRQFFNRMQLTAAQRKALGIRCLLGSMIFALVPLMMGTRGITGTLFHLAWAVMMAVGAILTFAQGSEKK